MDLGRRADDFARNPIFSLRLSDSAVHWHVLSLLDGAEFAALGFRRHK
jgi:hypothetical protein